MYRNSQSNAQRQTCLCFVDSRWRHVLCRVAYHPLVAEQFRTMDSSSVRSDEDYDVISGSLDSSLVDFAHIGAPSGVREIPPTEEARQAFNTVAFLASDIQAYVANALRQSDARGVVQSTDRIIRVYVDGVFDVLGAQ